MSSEETTSLAERLIPPAELKPAAVAGLATLPSFKSKMRECERVLGTRYSEVDHSVQEALVLRRLRQLVNIVMLNPAWRERLQGAGLTGAPATFQEWQDIPLADKEAQRELFMGSRPGLVMPLSAGGFEIVASGGTSGGQPLESVYSLRELHDTYEVAGDFLGTYLLRQYLGGVEPSWLFTTLADYQMWSSGTMVGGVLQHVPDVNYIGAGPVTAAVLRQMFSYPGPKAMMGITASIALMTELGAGLSQEARDSFRVALYGSGILSHCKRTELHEMYPQLVILSYFAATQAETIGLQLWPSSPYLAAVPGLHLIEIVDENGRWVADGEEGELVVTRLHGHEAPLLRLKLGDRMIRRPRIDGPGLKTGQFEFAGRSGDILHLGDTQYSATRAYAALHEGLKAANVLDLELVAHDVQFRNDREERLLTLLAAVDDVHGLGTWMSRTLGPHDMERIFSESLGRALSVFNDGEANSAYMEKTGYRFELRLVDRFSAEIERTAVGKVPLVRDVAR
ncbi:hypothetical protein ACGFNU_32830 [Spirillospora sp. NPDC048911]|uniref:hypothetical protein n=1 Tax=Spirillospora sp. NPDC048911 TaxID=3364527 RepID=UPI003712CECB